MAPGEAVTVKVCGATDVEGRRNRRWAPAAPDAVRGWRRRYRRMAHGQRAGIGCNLNTARRGSAAGGSAGAGGRDSGGEQVTAGGRGGGHGGIARCLGSGGAHRWLCRRCGGLPCALLKVERGWSGRHGAGADCERGVTGITAETIAGVRRRYRNGTDVSAGAQLRTIGRNCQRSALPEVLPLVGLTVSQFTVLVVDATAR